MTPLCDPEKTVCIKKIQISSPHINIYPSRYVVEGPDNADYARDVVKRNINMVTPAIDITHNADVGGGGKPSSSPYRCGDCDCDRDGERRMCKGGGSRTSPPDEAEVSAKDRGVGVFRESKKGTSRTDHLAHRSSTDSLTAVSSTETTDDGAALPESSSSDAAARRLNVGGEECRRTCPSRDVFDFDDCERKGNCVPLADDEHATIPSNPSAAPRRAPTSPSTATVGVTAASAGGGRSATTPTRPSPSRTASPPPSTRRRSIFGDYWRNSRVATSVEIANAVSGKTDSPALSPVRSAGVCVGGTATPTLPPKDGGAAGLEARHVIEMQRRMQRDHEVREQDRAMAAAASTYSVDLLDQAEYSTHTGRLYTDRSFLDSHHHRGGTGSGADTRGAGGGPGGQPFHGGGRSPFLFNPVFGAAGGGGGMLPPTPSLSDDGGDDSSARAGALRPRLSERRIIPRPNPLGNGPRAVSERCVRPTEPSSTAHNLKVSTSTVAMDDDTVASPPFSPQQSLLSSTASLSSPPSSLEQPLQFRPKSILRKPRIGKRGSHKEGGRLLRSIRGGNSNRSNDNIYAADTELWRGRDSTCGKTNVAAAGGGGGVLGLGPRRGSFGNSRSRRNSQDAGGAIDPDHESIFSRPGCVRIPQHLERMPHPNHDHFPFGGSPPHRSGLLPPHSPSMASPDASSHVRRGSLGARRNHVHYDPRVCIVEYMSDSEEEDEDVGVEMGGPIGALLGGYRRARRERDGKGGSSSDDDGSDDGSDDSRKILRVPDSSSKWFTNEELADIRLNAIRDAQRLLLKTGANRKTPNGITSPSDHLRASGLGLGSGGGVRSPQPAGTPLHQAAPPTRASSQGASRGNAVPLAIFGGGHLSLTRSSSDPGPATATRRRALFTNPILRVTPDDNVLLEGSPELSEVLSSHVRRILVVEPHPAMRSLFERGLRHMMPHADVTACSSVEEAMDVIDDHAKRVIEQSWLADSDDEKKEIAGDHGECADCCCAGGRRDCVFDIVIVEERLSNGSSARLMQSSDDIHALEKNAPTNGDELLQRSRSQSKIEHAQKQKQRRRGMPMSGSRLLHHLSLGERRRAEVDGGLRATEAGSAPPSSTTSPPSSSSSCFRPSLLIGVSSSLAEDGEKLTKAGADLIWGKPPPKMDMNLRNQMVMTLLEKRGEPTMICG